MKNNKTMYVLFAIALLSVYLNLAWDAVGMISPFYYNMVMGAIFTCFALLHCNTYAGRKSIVVLAVLTFAITFIMEYTGVKTGFIYGEYHYGAVLGPKALDTVPWLVPLSWFMFMYVSTVTVDAAFGGRYVGWATPLLLAVLDSVAMTALDVLIDPLWVKAWHLDMDSSTIAARGFGFLRHSRAKLFRLAPHDNHYLHPIQDHLI